ncbi:restriction endonuclease subunit S [Parageobacillus thermoglucosidasius]|uniref:restriction endonuclease subunit S n=1 Tax=Parageobacillus thermoglucosidasius TaxID=1426 RepID=UPI0001D189C7|nr:restriction endonuclease subunit S [Parageobacillus thermoglucosidasius]AEH49140.1 restriction modification system DNA specificity domain protein [Parageobacillus thermoglucosidasius C56-YS93]
MNDTLSNELKKALIDRDKQPYEIPPNWIWTRLDNVCYEDRQTVKPDSEEAKRLLYLGMEDVEANTGIINKISEDVGKSNTYKFDSTHILYGKLRPYLNKVALPDFEGRCTTEFIPLKPEGGISREYLALFLRTQKVIDTVMAKSKGSRMPRADMKVLMSIEFPLPPVSEQRRIIKKVKSYFKIIDKIEKELAKAKELLKKRHESLLQKAFRGELVKREENDKSTFDLLNIKVSSSTDENDPYDIPENWVWLELGDCGVITGGGTPSKKVPSFWNGNILWVSPKDMKRDKINDTEDKITELAIEKSSAKLIPKNSVLFVVRSGILRHSLPVAINDVELTVNQDIKAITPHEFINVSYLFYAFKCFEKSWLQEASKIGATVESLDMEKVKKLKVPVPPLSEQLKIIERLEKEFEKEQAIVQSIERAEEKLQKMRQSLLQKAFRGELVEQRPEEGTGLDLLKEIIEEKLKLNKEK